MPKLSDTQLILLSTASQRPGGSFYPLSTSLAEAGDRGTTALAGLAKCGFAEERETREAASVQRTDGDISYGMFITDAGIAAIDGQPDQDREPVSPHSGLKAERISKNAAVIILLQRAGGATLAEFIEITGWLPHTTRAVLTGLRKKGHVVERGKRGDETCYRIIATA